MTHTVSTLLEECIYLTIKPDIQSTDEKILILVTDDPEVDSNYEFELHEREDGYYNIMDENDKLVGGIKQEEGRLTGKINLSTISSYNTCIIIQLASVDNAFLLQPMSPKSKYDPRKTQFITKGDFNDG